MMSETLHEKIVAINLQLVALLEYARKSLRGEANFSVQHVRALSAPISEMAPIMARSKELRVQHPEVATDLDRYKSTLGELHVTLQQVNMMLLAQRAQMEYGRTQLKAVSQWATTLSHTR